MRDRTRIAMIIPGGIGTGKNNIGVPVLERIIARLSGRFDVTVFQLYPRNSGFTVDTFKLVDTYSRIGIFKIIKCVSALAKHHRSAPFAVIHGYWTFPGGWLAVLLGKFFGIRSVVSVLGGDAVWLPEIKYGQLGKPFYRSMILWALRRAGTVVALTAYLVENLRRAGLRRDDILVIPWGIDVEQFFYMEKPMGLPLRFLHIGNLYPVKDQETLLRAFKMICDNTDARLTIIGEGILLEKLKQLIDELRLSDVAKIHETVPYAALPGFYHDADFLLHTSLSEGQCEVVTEAMSAGILVCGTRVGLMYDLPDCCLAVNPRDYTALANVVLDAIKDPDELSAQRARARLWAEKHTIGWTVDRLAEIYQS